MNPDAVSGARAASTTAKRRIVYIQYTNPAAYPPLEHSSRVLAQTGWDVLFVGTRQPSSALLEFPDHPRIRVERMTSCAAGLRQKLHYGAFAVWALARSLTWRADWVYASDPLSAPVALLATLLPGVRVVYHEHDSPLPQPRRRRFLMWTRRHLAKRAAFCVLPNERRRQAFVEETRSNDVMTVWNCPRIDEVAPSRQVVDDRIVLLYHGSIVPERVPVALIHALALLPAHVSLEIVGYETLGGIGYSERLKNVAREVGVADRVKFLGPMPRFRLLEHCRSAHIGLALMPTDSPDLNMREMVGASNKVFDYLASGLAVLVSDLHAWRHTFVDDGYGAACVPDDPGSIAKAVSSLSGRHETIREMGERGRQKILRDWNYETQFAAVARRLDQES